MEADVTVDNLIQFVNDYQNNKLKRVVKSDPIPKEPYENGVRIVVGETFEQIVLDENTDVLIWIYIEDKPPQELSGYADFLKNITGLVIAEMGISENIVNGAPRYANLYLYARGRKSDPISFYIEKSTKYREENLLKFLRKYSSIKSPEHGITGLNWVEKFVWFVSHMLPCVNVVLPFLEL